MWRTQLLCAVDYDIYILEIPWNDFEKFDMKVKDDTKVNYYCSYIIINIDSPFSFF